ncbi:MULTISPECIES: type II toxin-antitoxin system RelE/ParE family toxin [unclassified Methylobacterium]|uniref:type II toxin-antitoxin system RelE/ParE family toxin n=1 Tax=unclassified Methylobacterium TaxID=2615210 RepID=UPI00226ADED8|nr:MULTISPECIES: type II toxin-antitoxin system RelE/ParE family toxin [unclassified Methylobacterium]
MIQSFADKATEALHLHDSCHRQWRAFKAAAVRKLDMIDAAATLGDLRSPPGNQLEKLSGDRDGQWSIRINDQWRICFKWGDAGPENVEIVDYHRG